MSDALKHIKTSLDISNAGCASGRLAALREVLAWISTTQLRVNKQNMTMRLKTMIAKEEGR